MPRFSVCAVNVDVADASGQRNWTDPSAIGGGPSAFGVVRKMGGTGKGEAFRNITANIPSDYDLLNLRVFQAGGIQGDVEQGINNLTQEAIDQLVGALNTLTEAARSVRHWLEKVANKIESWIENMGGGGGDGGGYNAWEHLTGSEGVFATSGSEASGGANRSLIVNGDLVLTGVTDPESLFRKLEGIRERRRVVVRGSPSFRRS